MKYSIYSKLTAVVTAFVMAVCIMPSVYSADDVSESLDNALTVVTSLGIMENSLSGDFDAGSGVTKAEFAKVLLNALAIDYSHYSGDASFADMTSDNPDLGAMVFAYNLGIISGNGNGYIEADSHISYVQAVKMAVSAMGYAPLAEKSGGYPVGYMKMCEHYMDFRPDYDADFTRGEAARFIYELLDAPIMEIKGYNTSDPVYNYGTKSSKTLLNQCGFDVYRGIMTSTPFETTVAEEGFSDEGCVTVSARSFKITDEDNYHYFATGVEVYHSLENRNTAVCIVAEQGTVVTEIMTEDIDITETSEKSIVYYDGGNEVKLRLSNPVMIYNGEGVVFNKELMAGKSGIVKVITNNTQGICNVIVRCFENRIAAGVDYDENIYPDAPLSDGRSCVSSDDGVVVVLNCDGDIVSPVEIEPGNVLSVEISRTGLVTRINICDEKLEGEVQKQDDKLIINGVEYTALCDISDINVRDRYTFYLNCLGQICRIEPETNVEKYGYLVDAGSRNELGSKLILRIFRTNGSLTDYECAPKLKFNGETSDTTSAEAVSDILASLASTSITQIDGKKYQQVIKYTSNSDGYINSIQTSGSDGFGDTVERSFDYEDRKYRKETESFGDFFVGPDTVIFNIPFKADKQSGENMAVASGFRFANEETYSTVVYDCDDSFVAGVIVNFTGTVQGGISIDSHIAVFDRATDVIDENGEGAHKLYVYELGKEKSYIVYYDSAIDVTSYSKGDLLKLLVSGNECISIECDLDIVSAENPPDDFQLKAGSYSGASYTSGIAHMAQMRKVFGSIALYNDDRIVVEAKGTDANARVLAKASGFGSITVCDFAKDDIYVIAPSMLGAYTQNVNPDARAFIHMRYGAPMSMVVYVFR